MNVSLSLRKQENRMFFAPNSEVVVDFKQLAGKNCLLIILSSVIRSLVCCVDIDEFAYLQSNPICKRFRRTCVIFLAIFAFKMVDG